MSKMVDMVKVFCFAVETGRVAVHCHAGLGRTGLFIASYLIYKFRMTAKDAIYYIRDKRFFILIKISFFLFFHLVSFLYCV